MDPLELHVKNMVCRHCKMVLAEALDQIEGLAYEEITLGHVKLKQALTAVQRKAVETALVSLGFELLDDERSQLIQEIRNLIIAEVHHSAKQKRTGETFSDFISRKIGYDYSYLNEQFAAQEGRTIGQFIILHKIEKVKELLVYDELSLSQIAHELGYSSAQYLSAQFKKFTGLTPSHFKKIGQDRRKSLDQV